LNLKYQENEWNSSRTQGRRVPPPPQTPSTCGNSRGWNARGHVGGDPRPRQRSGAYARLDPSRQYQSRADTAGCSWLFITGGKEHYLSQWHEKERVGEVIACAFIIHFFFQHGLPGFLFFTCIFIFEGY